MYGGLARVLKPAAIALLVVLAAAALGTSAFAQGNLAPFGTASASTTYSNDYSPEKSNDGNTATRWSANQNTGQWYQIEWAAPQTFNAITVRYFGGFHIETFLKVEVWNADTSSWVTVANVSDAPNVLPLTTSVSFPKVTTSRIRISDVVTFTELEVYLVNVTGHVTTSSGGRPLGDVIVTSGEQTTSTDGTGLYLLYLEPGNRTVTAELSYMYATANAVVPEDGLLNLDIQMDSVNLGPLGTASASSTYPGYPASNCNDDNPGSRWSKLDDSDPDEWYQIDWASPQTFDTVLVRYFPGSHAERVLTVETWNEGSSSWQTTAVVGDDYEVLPLLTVAKFSPVTTTKLRISHVITFNELEVYSGVGTVSGYVMDSATNMGIGCATVKGGFAPVTTGFGGDYSFDAPATSILLRAEADTYSPVQQNVNVPSGGLSKDLLMARKAGNLAGSASQVTPSSTMIGSDVFNAYDGYPCSRWDVDEAEVTGTLEFQWASPQTMDTVQIGHGTIRGLLVDIWRNGAWFNVGKAGNAASLTAAANVAFTPVATTRLRLRNILGAAEVGIYNLMGPAPTANLTGTVTRASNGTPLAGATITVGALSAKSGGNGQYFLAVPPGDVDVVVTRPGYDSDSQSVLIPASGSIGVDFSLTSDNIAPFATATSSTSIPGYEAGLGNDDDWDSRYSKTPGDANPWYQLEWPSPVTINRVKVHQLADPGGAFGMRFLEVQVWDGASWQVAGRIDGLKPPVPAIVDMPFGVTTTNGIRLLGIETFWEVEVFTAPNIVTGSIGTVRGLEDGSAVQITGAITAIFPELGCGYIEALDRSAGLRIEPLSKLGYIVNAGPNLAPAGTAIAESEIGGYEASKANDGSLATRWSAQVRDQYYEIGWASPQTFNSVTIHNLDESWNYTTPVIQVWNSNTSQWDDVATGYLTSSKLFTFPTVTTDRIRVLHLTTIYELEVRTYSIDTSGLLKDMSVTVLGSLATRGKERAIVAGQVLVGESHTTQPLGMANLQFSTENTGASTIGLLAKTWGRVTRVEAAPEGASYVYLNDGSNVPSDATGAVGVKVGPIVTDALKGNFVVATGIASAFDSGGVGVRTLRPRGLDDFEKYPVQLGPNLALQGTASAQSTYPGYDALYGNDGLMNTRWSGNANYQWFEIDWPSAKEFNTVILRNLDEGWNKFQTCVIQIWDEGSSSWVDVGSAVVDSASVVFDLPAVQSSKVRITNVTTFWELEVYNKV